MGIFGKRLRHKSIPWPTHDDSPQRNSSGYNFPGGSETTDHLEKMGSKISDELLAETQIVEFLKWRYADLNGVHFPTVLAVIGSLAGFSVQMAARNGRVGDNLEDIGIKSKVGDDGHTYFSGPSLNALLLSENENVLSIWRLVAGAALKTGLMQSNLPQIDQLVTACEARIGKTGYGRLSLEAAHQPKEHGIEALKRNWADIREIMDEHGVISINWSKSLSIVAQDVILQAQRFGRTAISVQIVIESAIAMSKIDPGRIMGTAEEQEDGDQQFPGPKTYNKELIGLNGDGSAPPTAKAILEVLKKDFTVDEDIDYPGLLGATGALAGFAAQQTVWRAFVHDQQIEPDKLLLTVSGQEDGHTYYFGDALNMILASTQDGQMSIWRLVAAAPLQVGASTQDLPDVREMFSDCTKKLGGADFGRMRVAPEYAPKEHGLSILSNYWRSVQELLVTDDTEPMHWPLVLAEMGQELILEAKESVPPLVGLRIVMESAIAMSKIDPRRIMPEVSDTQVTKHTEPLLRTN